MTRTVSRITIALSKQRWGLRLRGRRRKLLSSWGRGVLWLALLIWQRTLWETTCALFRVLHIQCRMDRRMMWVAVPTFVSILPCPSRKCFNRIRAPPARMTLARTAVYRIAFPRIPFPKMAIPRTVSPRKFLMHLR